MDKKFAEQKQCFDQANAVLRYELKKDAHEQNMKHHVDFLNVKNEVKANDLKMEAKMKEHELNVIVQIREGEIKRLKNFGWFLGVSTAFLGKFSNVFDSIFKKPTGKD
ncbi:hypothetical protein C2845_PM13G23830 [Panicum miliaceum]|uniref:Uncharacterized protein n=1 Tax=Panicum miliaceum TaxID=4540 RepID=A0A3L6RJQ0_PANMI|nr:hypothetical protein C2845_PM13G23830 [Panicum miliaceum]